MIEKLIIPVTPLMQNCSLVWETTTQKGCFIDPGGDIERLKQAATQAAVCIECILLTHGHLDHAAGAGELATHYHVPIYGPHKDDLFLFETMTAQCLMYNFPTFKPFMPDIWLQEGDCPQIGSLRFEVLHTPGHTPGHIIYYHRPTHIAWVGDVLFDGSIGRSDFPRGDGRMLIRSICQKLWPLGKNVTFVHGHGALSTFGVQRQTNPYVADHITGYNS